MARRALQVIVKIHVLSINNEIYQWFLCLLVGEEYYMRSSLKRQFLELFAQGVSTESQLFKVIYLRDLALNIATSED